MSPTEEQVLKALSSIEAPRISRDLVSLDLVHDLRVEGGSVSCTLELPVLDPTYREEVRAAATEKIAALDGVDHAEVRIGFRAWPSGAPPSGPEGSPKALPEVRNVVAVGSGKGGVGKSTVAVNLAVTLAGLGARVGLLDADIYGPSIPTMLGLRGQVPLVDESQRKILPLQAHGIKTISMGFLLKDSDAIVWRGPMLGKALQQFLEDGEWGKLDYLIVDLPPGTGDVQLSLAQLIPVGGAVVVTTPQDVAHADVTRAAKMFRMLKTPILGLVENMAWFDCPDNEKRYFIFGEGRTKDFAKQNDLDLLEQFPIDLSVAPSGDQGTPIVVGDPEGVQARHYQALAHKVVAKLWVLAHEAARKKKVSSFFTIKPRA